MRRGALPFRARDMDDLQPLFRISRKLRKSGMPPLMLPGSVFCVDGIPKLGSGKWDFNGMKKLALEMVESR